MISWFNRKYISMELSTIEVEYFSTSDASKESIWICKLLARLFGDMLEMTTIHCDNQSFVKLSENPMYHDRSENIEMRYHYFRDMVQKGSIQLQYIPIDEKIVDVFTKPLSTTKFVYLPLSATKFVYF